MLAAAAYQREDRSWTRTSPLGDFAIVGVQRSRASLNDEIGFYVNLAIVPLPWWDWLRFRSIAGATPQDYNGLFRWRLPHGRLEGAELWWVGGANSAAEIGTDVSTQLQSVGLPRLSQLLDRDQLAAAIRGAEHGLRVHPDDGRAALLTDQGVTDELDELLSRMSTGPGPIEEFREWAYARASSRGIDPARRSTGEQERRP